MMLLGGHCFSHDIDTNRMQKSEALQHYVEYVACMHLNHVQMCNPGFAANDLNARINYSLHLHARWLCVITMYLFKPRLVNTIAPSFVNDLYI